MANSKTKTLCTSVLSLQGVNPLQWLVSLDIVNCSKKNVTGTLYLLDINGSPVIPADTFSIAPGKVYGNGTVAFPASSPFRVEIYGVVRLKKGTANDIRASLSIIDDKGYSVISAEAR
jgi:hypothetical protein